MSHGIFLGTLKRSFCSVDVNVNYVYACTSCFDHRAGLFGSTLRVSIVSLVITMLTNLVVFPTTFSINVSPSDNPSLVFVALPGIFGGTFTTLPMLK